ncbi:Bidirectional sugar transporter SWEET [Citrus sinensis]|nr:Bidirectional sugar transporter SWEET [Citrus sinensis]
MLLLYYASLKGSNAFMLITINGIGYIIESLYLLFFMIYATKTAKIYTTKLLILFNIGALGLIVLLTYLLSKSSDQRLTIVGWICAVFSVCVFAAPLSIITPNILGMAFGATQMILYLAYRTRRNSEILPVAAAVVDPKDREESNNTGAADPCCNHHHRHDSSNGEVEIKAVETNQINHTA